MAAVQSKATLTGLDEACGSTGTMKASYQKVADAIDAQIKTLTPECKKSVLCTLLDDDDKKDDKDDDKKDDDKKCCLDAMTTLNMYGELIKECDPFAAKLKAATAEEKTAAEAMYKA